MIYQGVKVNGNAKGCAKLISTGVTLANGLAGSVSFVGYAGIREKLLDSSNKRHEFNIRLEIINAALDGGNGWGQAHDDTLFILGITLVERVLQECVKNTPNTKRWLNDARNKFDNLH